MERRPFSQVLKDAKVDIRREYDRLYGMFCIHRIANIDGTEMTLKEMCAVDFINFPFRGTCVSLADFDDFYGFHFEKAPFDFDTDYLIYFCEYSYNLVIYSRGLGTSSFFDGNINRVINHYNQQVTKVIDSIGYMANTQDGITHFVPKDQAAISVAEIVDPGLSYKVIEYNHHSMEGDLEKKKAVLLALADQLEPRRDKLKQINSSLASDLFFLFNTVNLRHNNKDPKGKNFVSLVSNMESDEIERWYDDIYQMCLLAFLELDNLGRKERVKKLKEDINGKE